MGDEPVRVLLAARPSVAGAIAASLRRSTIEVEVVDELDRSAAATADVVAVEHGVADWTDALGLRCRVVVLAPGADASTVYALLAEGADDVMARTDRPQEAAARIRALSRRRAGPTAGRSVRVGDVVLDRESRSVTCGGRPVSLTRRQFDLLDYLLANAGVVVTRTALLEHVWDMATPAGGNAVEAQISRLRDALGDDRRHPARILTARGIGYLYARSARDVHLVASRCSRGR